MKEERAVKCPFLSLENGLFGKNLLFAEITSTEKMEFSLLDQLTQ